MLWSILGGSALYYLLGLTIPGFYDGFAAGVELDPLAAFGEFGVAALGQVFTAGFDFSHYLAGHDAVELAVVLISTTALAFLPGGY